MKKTLIILGLLLTHAACAANTLPLASSRKISQSIDAILASSDHNLNVGIKVIDAKKGTLIYEKNSDRQFVPASSLKLFTAVAALYYLGPEYQFPTRFVTNDDTQKEGVLNGNLYLKLSGDPTLARTHLIEMARALRDSGIKKIQREVYYDNTAFERAGFGPGWMWDDEKYCFSAPVGAAILDKNCLTIQVRGNKRVGQPLQIKSNEQLSLLKLKNKTKTTKKGGKHCKFVFDTQRQNHFTVRGCMPMGTGYYEQEVALTNPDLYTALALRRALTKTGIKFNGLITMREAPTEAKVLAEHLSSPLRTLLATVLKDSDNLVADAVYKKMGELFDGKQGTWKSGSRAVTAILKEKLGEDIKTLHMLDGSGMSRYNLVSPALITKLLSVGYHDFSISSELMAALAISGVDGKLKDRFTLPELQQKVRAKTGTLTNVTALAGFIETDHHHTLIFSIMMNGAPGKIKPYKKLEEEICQLLIQSA